MENEIKSAISYFTYFSYPPTSQEIYTFFKKKTSTGHFTSILEKMVKKGAVIRWKIDGRRLKMEKRTKNRVLSSTFHLLNSSYSLPRYTLGEYSTLGKISNLPPSLKLRRTSKSQISKVRSFEIRKRISKKKIKKIDRYVNLLSIFPQIKLIGLSGSVAMLNADEDHDIDLFIITDKNRLWTGRLISLLLVSILGLRRKRNRFKAKDKVCLNLFFDEARLDMPKYKRTEYVAHEILQMRPLVNKNNVYGAFLEQNKWVYKIFPNASRVIASTSMSLRAKRSNLRVNSAKQFHFNQIASSSRIRGIPRNDKSIIGNILEYILKILQLNIIKLHQTTEIVTDTQLWFHPDDFGKKIRLNRV